MKNFDWKKFIEAVLVLFPVLLVIDVLYDIILKQLVWADTFALKNITFKILAAVVGAYFFVTYKNEGE